MQCQSNCCHHAVVPLLQDIFVFTSHRRRSTQRLCCATAARKIMLLIYRATFILSQPHFALGSSLSLAFPFPCYRPSTLVLLQIPRKREIVLYHAITVVASEELFPSTGVPCIVDIVRNQECRTSDVLLWSLRVLDLRFHYYGHLILHRL